MAKFDQVESAVKSLDKEVKNLTSDMQKLINLVNENSKSQAELAAKTNQVKKATDQISATEKERINLQKQLNKALDEGAVENADLRLRVQELNKANREAAREKRGLIGAYEKESRKLNDLRKKYKDLAVQNRQNTKEGKALLANITQLDAKLKSVDASVGQNQRNVGKYQNALKGLGKQVLALGSAYLGLQGVVKIFKKIGESVKNNSQAVSDALDVMKAKFNATFDAIGRAIANMDLSSLASDIRAARAAAEEYTKAQDELGDTMRSIGIETAKVESEVFKLREIYTDTGQEASKRLEAVQKANKLLLDLQQRRSEVANNAITAELKLVSQTLGLTEEEQKLFESFITDYGKKEGIYFEFQQKNIKFLEKRAELEQKVIDGTTTSIGFQGAVSNTYTQEAQKAQKELQALADNQLKSYDKLVEAENAVSDSQRTRIANAITDLFKQEKATQRLINETSRQESAIKRSNKNISDSTIEREKVQVMAQLDRIEATIPVEEQAVDDLILVWEEYYKKKQDLRDQDAIDEEAKRQENIENTVAALDFISQTTDAVFDLTQANRQSELDNLLAQKDAEIAAAEKTGADTAKIQKKYADKEKQIRREQAQAEKRKALFDIAIATAVAIAKSIPNPVLIALSAALGAVQLATVAAKPIPKFKEGTKGKLREGTFAVVGDGFEHELISTPDGSFLSDNKPQTVWLPKGSEVFSGADTKELMQENRSNIVNLDPLIKEQKATRAAIMSKNNAPVWTERSLSYRDKKRNQNINYISKYIRGTV